MVRRNMRLVVLAGILAAAAVLGGRAAMTTSSQAGTLTGCLRAGSASDVLLLRSASIAGLAAGTPDDFLLVGVSDRSDLATHVNHRMAITGVVSGPTDPPAPPAGANAAERALKRLSVREAREVAASCGDNR